MSATGPRPDPEIVIIGSGFGAIGMAIRLAKAGIRSFTILEKADDVGGTWRDNTYPGAACDVASVLYSFSFEPSLTWSRRYPPQHEVLDYLHRCVEKHGLRPHFQFGTEVSSARFDEAAGRWTVTTADGREIRSRVLVSAVGQLSLPKLPEIDGLDTFEGPVFHTARWDHGAELDGKRVAVVGGGSSGVQLATPLAETAASLTLFQRTVPYLIRKPNAEYTDRDRRRWQRWPALQKLERVRFYLQREQQAIPYFTRPQQWTKKTEGFLARLAAEVPDADLRQKLTPDYPMGCKRIVVSDDFYDTVARPDVELVTDRIDHVEAGAVVTTDGVRREVDAIVLATGFQATRFLAPMEITGTGGRTLEDAWSTGSEAYLGMAVNGFPNLFLLFGPNTNLGYTSVVFMLERQIGYVLRCVEHLRSDPDAYMEVRASVQQRFGQWLDRALASTVWASGACSSWYVDEGGRVTTLWPSYTFNYARRTRRLRLSDYRVGHATIAPLAVVAEGYDDAPVSQPR